MGEVLGIIGIVATVLIGVPAWFIASRKKSNTRRIDINNSTVHGDVTAGNKTTGSVVQSQEMKK